MPDRKRLGKYPKKDLPAIVNEIHGYPRIKRAETINKNNQINPSPEKKKTPCSLTVSLPCLDIRRTNQNFNGQKERT